jgi:hypothetical protein
MPEVSAPGRFCRWAFATRPEQSRATGMSRRQVLAMLTDIAAIAEAVASHFVWRPQLRDTDDQLVLHPATSGKPPREGDALPEGCEPLAECAAPAPAQSARRVRKAAQPVGATDKPARVTRRTAKRKSG